MKRLSDSMIILCSLLLKIYGPGFYVSMCTTTALMTDRRTLRFLHWVPSLVMQFLQPSRRPGHSPPATSYLLCHLALFTHTNCPSILQFSNLRHVCSLYHLSASTSWNKCVTFSYTARVSIHIISFNRSGQMLPAWLYTQHYLAQQISGLLCRSAPVSTSVY